MLVQFDLVYYDNGDLVYQNVNSVKLCTVLKQCDVVDLNFVDPCNSLPVPM